MSPKIKSAILPLLSSAVLLFAATGAAADTFYRALAAAAQKRASSKVRYDGAYLRIPYPNGDVPADMGVCTDEIVRIYRAVGVDLQKEVHEDMAANFSRYPKSWGMRSTDTNIDHRRVPNLAVFFGRRGETLPPVAEPSAYSPGDIVVWELSNGLPHIDMVVSGKSADGERPLVLHNIGAGPKVEDALYVGRITGHYRYKKG